MPTRTVFPTISITCTTTSSPTMIFSPTRRVMSSMVPPWIQLRGRDELTRERIKQVLRVLRGGHDVGREQLGADRSIAGLVDHLMALAIGDEDRSAQVRVEVGQLGAG